MFQKPLILCSCVGLPSEKNICQNLPSPKRDLKYDFTEKSALVNRHATHSDFIFESLSF